jgi:hypothetical protein
MLGNFSKIKPAAGSEDGTGPAVSAGSEKRSRLGVSQVEYKEIFTPFFLLLKKGFFSFHF